MRILTTALVCLLALTALVGPPLAAPGAEARRSASSMLDGDGNGGGSDGGDDGGDEDDDDEDVRALG